jgi:hypothetical protein
MAPKPPGVSAVPVAASVIKEYWRSNLGKAMTGSEMSCLLRETKAALATLRQWSPFVSRVFPGKLKKWRCDDGEVLDVGPEEIA